MNQKIQSLQNEIEKLQDRREAAWHVLADLYDEEAALTGYPSRSGRTREEIKSAQS